MSDLQLPSGLVSAKDIHSDTAEETRLLRDEHAAARDYLAGHSWCDSVVDAWYADGVAKTITFHLFRIRTQRPDIPELLWVFYGDVPPAYLPLEDAPTLERAIRLYVEELEEWIRRVRAGEDTSALMPVNGSPTPENADLLERRVRTIREWYLQ